MRRALHMVLPLVMASLAPMGQAPASFAAPSSQVVDRIVARIEDDIITLSEERELAAYQQLVEGRAEPEDQLLHELIEQWVVRSEAQAAQFEVPAEQVVSGEITRIEGNFPSPQAYRERLAALGLDAEAVRRIVGQQIYLARYLDYKFRPAVRVEEEEITKYYNQELTPALRAKSQTPPPLDTVSEQIRELLTVRGIDERAASWFEETKSRLRIATEPARRTGTERHD